MAKTTKIDEKIDFMWPFWSPGRLLEIHCDVSSLNIRSNRSLTADMSYYPDGVTLSSTITEGYHHSESWHFRYFYFINGKCIAPKLTFDIEKIDIEVSKPREIEIVKFN